MQAGPGQDDARRRRDTRGSLLPPEPPGRSKNKANGTIFQGTRGNPRKAAYEGDGARGVWSSRLNLGSPRGFGTPVPPLPTSLGSRWLPVQSRHGHSVTMTTRTTVPTHFLEATEPKGRPRSGSSVPERRRDAADGSVVSGRRREACVAGRRLPGHARGARPAAEVGGAPCRTVPSRPRGTCQRSVNRLRQTGAAARPGPGTKRAAALCAISSKVSKQKPLSEQTRPKSPQGRPLGWFTLQRGKATC